MLLGMGCGQATRAAELLFDFNSTTTASASFSSNQHARIGSATLFVMDDGSHGAELWRTDGTTAGTLLVKDINPGPTGSNATGLTELNDKVVFFADDGTNGIELWVSDGTPAGTHIVSNIDGASESSVISFSYPLLQLNGAVLFAAQQPAAGHYTLWRSDGTAAGTWQVKDVDTSSGIGQGLFSGSVVVGSHLFFSGRDPVYGLEPWVTDGTPDGTHIIADIAPGTADSAPREFTATTDAVYFSAGNPATGRELYQTDLAGTAARLVSDYVPGANGSAPEHLMALGNQLFYAALDAPGLPLDTVGVAGSEPFVSNGTVAGTHRIADVYPGYVGSNPTGIARLGNKIIFQLGSVPGNTSTLWTTDGSAAETVGLQGYPFAPYLPTNFVELNGKLLFMSRLGDPYGTDAIWQTDGSPEGTSIFANLASGYGIGGSELLSFGGRLYFPDGFLDTTYGEELWTADGTGTGTQRVKDINPGPGGSQPNGLYVSNGKLYFFASDKAHGNEPWISDGTSAGTRLLCDCNPAIKTANSNAAIVANLGSSMLINADDGTHGSELWVTDGTKAGTRLVRDINVGQPSSNAAQAMVVGGVAYFAANDGVNGNELWRSDGTSAGTYLLADISPGLVVRPPCQPGLYCPPPTGSQPPASSDPSLDPFSSLIANGVIYFTADDGTHGRELWRTDGTPAGTRMVVDLTPGQPPSYISLIGAAGSRVYFCGTNDPTSAPHLWMTDGTAQGTVLVSSRVVCYDQSLLQGAVLNGVVYFVGSTGNYDYELWRSDGTDAGTVQVVQIAQGNVSASPNYLHVVGNRLAFGACDSSSCGFYLSDGTAAGTVRVPGVGPVAAPPVLLGSRLLFATQTTGPNALPDGYITDGTVAGTHEFLPQSTFPKGINLAGVTQYLGKYVFTALDAANNLGAWTSDGTVGGTQPLFISASGANGSVSAYGFSVLGSSLFFSGMNAIYGSEIWVVRNGAPTATDDTANAGFNTPSTINVLNNDGAASGSLDQSSITLVSQPSHGTVTINTATGAIVYTPQAGFSGMDELSYQMSDTAGRISNVAQLSVLVAAATGSASAPPPAGSTTPTPPPPPVQTPPPPVTTPPDGSNPPPPSTPPTDSTTPPASTPPASPPASSGQGNTSASGDSGGGGGSESWLSVTLLGLLVLLNRRRRV
jgi:ELWxxDGT repeat protein